MSELPKTKTLLFAPEEVDERRDLQNAMLFGIIAVMVLVMLALIGVPTGVLNIPLRENVLVALAGLVVAIGGLIGLRMQRPVHQLAWSALLAWTVVLTAAIHFTGGPQTPMPAMYVLIVVAASFLLGRNRAMAIALFGLVNYAIMLALEYYGILPMVPIWNMTFEPHGRELLLIVNVLTVAAPTLVTATMAGTLAARLRDTNLNLRESERLRESLADMIVHDLRNPLTALLGGMDILRLTLSDQMSGDQKHLLENARRSGHALLGMVGELLDISKMEAGKFALNSQVVDLCELVTEASDQMRPLTENVGVQIRTLLCDEVKSVPCDKQLISRVVTNLLSNAIKHSPDGSTISVVVRQRGTFAMVSVTDNGPGISAEHRQRIFEKFGQIARPGAERRGTGLGLAFCKMAVEAHGGKIWVESEVEHGSTFQFTLPMSARPATTDVKREA
ncbi:MAG: HAMP domain-containing histidine kinase [Thermoflexales bacterium]|nr:HAMP domain-containing histidine kinase [Thermoflexales bacterium]